MLKGGAQVETSASELVDDIDNFLRCQSAPQLERLLLPQLTSLDPMAMRQPTRAAIVDFLEFDGKSCLAVVEVFFTAGDPELQLLPLRVEPGPSSSTERPSVSELRDRQGRRAQLCVDGANGPATTALMRIIAERSEIPLTSGKLVGESFEPLTPVLASSDICLLPRSPEQPQRNVSVLLSDVYSLKVFRRLETGPNPELEILRQLFAQRGYAHIPPVFGKIEYRSNSGAVYDAGMLQAFVDSGTDLWGLTADELSMLLDRLACEPPEARGGRDSSFTDYIQSYLSTVGLLAQRTAQMHAALALSDEPEFAPEAVDPFYLRGVCHLMVTRAAVAASELERRLPELAPELGGQVTGAMKWLRATEDIARGITSISGPGMRIRVHGDFHLGQVLHTGHDLVIIDFEGDSSRPLSERRIKASPLADVGSMLHSFLYAASSVAFNTVAGAFAWDHRRAELARHMNVWYDCVSSHFLEVYRDSLQPKDLVPAAQSDFDQLVNSLMLGKAVYQVGYDLKHQPEWLPVALSCLGEVVSRMKP